LHADDSPHRIALGVGIGLFAGFLPILGAQMVATIAIAALFRANKAAGVPMVFVTNPVTFLPIYGFCWWVGSLITGASAASRAHALTRLEESGFDLFQGFFHLDFWTGLLRLMVELGIALWIGCVVIGLAAGVLGYFLTRWGVTVYRIRRREKLAHRHQRRLERREARARQPLPTRDFA
jgi:uncharacterized protein (DUF2062 family)